MPLCVHLCGPKFENKDHKDLVFSVATGEFATLDNLSAAKFA